MTIRLILIVTILLQQLALPAVGSSAALGVKCDEPSCCRIIDTTTCCGEVVQEIRCGKTGGECLCHFQPDDSEPAPKAPRPTDRLETAPVFVTLVGNGFDVPVARHVRTLPASPAITRSHNETQALLCIWRI
jgi:hypothetical protein